MDQNELNVLPQGREQAIQYSSYAFPVDFGIEHADTSSKKRNRMAQRKHRRLKSASQAKVSEGAAVPQTPPIQPGPSDVHQGSSLGTVRAWLEEIKQKLDVHEFKHVRGWFEDLREKLDIHEKRASDDYTVLDPMVPNYDWMEPKSTISIDASNLPNLSAFQPVLGNENTHFLPYLQQQSPLRDAQLSRSSNVQAFAPMSLSPQPFLPCEPTRDPSCQASDFRSSQQDQNSNYNASDLTYTANQSIKGIDFSSRPTAEKRDLSAASPCSSQSRQLHNLNSNRRYFNSSGNAEDHITTKTQEDRFAAIMGAVDTAGFNSFDEMAIEYYTAKLKEDSPLQPTQTLSRYRHLKSFLQALDTSIKEWPNREAWGYREEILRSAQSILTDEILETRKRKVESDNAFNLDLQLTPRHLMTGRLMVDAHHIAGKFKELLLNSEINSSMKSVMNSLHESMPDVWAMLLELARQANVPPPMNSRIVCAFMCLLMTIH